MILGADNRGKVSAKTKHRNTEEEKTREVEDERSKRQERACRPGA